MFFVCCSSSYYGFAFPRSYNTHFHVIYHFIFCTFYNIYNTLHREFLHFLQIPVQASAGHFHSEELEFDPEWLAVLCRTHTLLQTHRGDVRLPQQVDKISAQVCAMLIHTLY